MVEGLVALMVDWMAVRWGVERAAWTEIASLWECWSVAPQVASMAASTAATLVETLASILAVLKAVKMVCSLVDAKALKMEVGWVFLKDDWLAEMMNEEWVVVWGGSLGVVWAAKLAELKVALLVGRRVYC